MHPETVAITSGREDSPGAPLNVPPTLASTYREGGPIGYGRWGNPTWSAFEAALGALEGGEAVSFASGQAAITALMTSLGRRRVAAPQDAYLGTRALLTELDNGRSLRYVPIDVTDTSAVVELLPEVDLLWLESPTNPKLGVADLPALVAAADERGVATVVDNTFATPLLQQPLALGATAVIHSATKFIGGHSDLLMGAAVTKDPALREELIRRRTVQGAIPGVLEAFLALRGLRTLPVRLERQQRTAALLAERLAEHPAVTRVRYPGMPADPFHLRAAATMTGFGAMVSFELSSAAAADRTVAALRVILSATSLGGVESTIDRRNRWPGEEDVPAGLLRLSVGLEHPDDLWADLDAALHEGAASAASASV